MQSRCDLMTRDTVGGARAAPAASKSGWAPSRDRQRVLDAMEKGHSRRKLSRLARTCASTASAPASFCSSATPERSGPTSKKTIRMVRETRPDDIGVSVSYPLPGTRFYQIVNAQLAAKANWSDSGDLAMMFQGAYTTGFYRALAGGTAPGSARGRSSGSNRGRVGRG